MLVEVLSLIAAAVQAPPTAPAPPAGRGESVRDVRLPRSFTTFRIPSASEAAVIRPLVEDYYKDDADKPEGLSVVRFDLNGDRMVEFAVQPTGRKICGAAGCPLFIVARGSTGWRMVLYYDIGSTRSFTVLKGSRGFRPISINGQRFYWGGSDDDGSYSSPSY